MSDRPFAECALEAERLMNEGHIIHQKFTCTGCGKRQTMDEANVFFTKGECEECGHITDIVKTGCGYLLIYGETP